MEYNENEFFHLEKMSSIFLNSVIDYLLIELKNNKYSATINFVFPNNIHNNRLKIQFHEITAISINQTTQSIAQQIHNYKFLMYEDQYYLSLDPDESILEVSDADQDFILFKKLRATLD